MDNLAVLVEYIESLPDDATLALSTACPNAPRCPPGLTC
jgi:hypothetical protein